MVAWGFIYYLLVNVGDVLEGFIPEFVFLGQGVIGNVYRLGADILSVSALLGMIFLLMRRFISKPSSLDIKEETLLHPDARRGDQA